MIFNELPRFFMDLQRISVILGLGCYWMPGSPVAGCGALWRPVGACGGKLWPLYTTMLGPRSLQAGRMVSGRMAVWLDGWMAGWLDGWMEVVGITAVT